VQAPSEDTWLALTAEELSVATAYDWAVRPSCGAVVLFSGTVRDHADGRPGVSSLTYEAYESQVVPRLGAIADEMRRRWPSVGRIALWHRVGPLGVGESSVIVTVSAAHRPEAFEAGRYGIDALKATVPIWKHEIWDGGSDWGLAATDITEAAEVAAPPPPPGVVADAAQDG
jgi:molybdopterin synthase catalytic subunit